jgi:hypothetical protein
VFALLRPELPEPAEPQPATNHFGTFGGARFQSNFNVTLTNVSCTRSRSTQSYDCLATEGV